MASSVVSSSVSAAASSASASSTASRLGLISSIFSSSSAVGALASSPQAVNPKVTARMHRRARVFLNLFIFFGLIIPPPIWEMILKSLFFSKWILEKF